MYISLYLLTTGIITVVLALSSVTTTVGLSSDTNPLGLSLASIVTVAEEASPILAPPVTSDRLIVKV